MSEMIPMAPEEMKISTTYGNIFIAVGEVAEMGPLMSLRNQKLPVRGSLQLRRLVRVLEPLYKDLMKERNDLILKHGEDKGIKFDSPNYPEFEKEINELMTTEVELDARPLHVSELGDILLSELELEALEVIIEE